MGEAHQYISVEFEHASSMSCLLVMPVSRIEFVLESSVYWPIIGFGTCT